MPYIKVHDKKFEIFLSENQIQEKVQEIARRINEDYVNKRPLFVAILNGAFMFASDLFKHLTIDAEICFIKLASYKGVKSTGNIITAIGLDQDLYNRNIIILEDIVDTGKTLSEFLPKLHHHHPASLKITALLHKPEAAQYPIAIEYRGFSIPNKFVVGYGLDYDGLGRNFREIFQLVGD
ncbi:MAG: hypoxanthine phosphoribosyltransferase [Chitinophagaceae bacterium]|nr:hypoxanthine phosphoribosyltransferase [Chitinophagaceae bacterium]